MKRIPEPELMNDPKHVATYAGHYLDNAYWLFVQCFQRYFPGLVPRDAILDLGCGPAAIPLLLARHFPHCEIHGVDGAPNMLAYGKKAVQREGLEQRVRLFHGILPENFHLGRERYEVVVSNYLLHHLADPLVLWNGIHKYCLPHAAVLIIDLLRPASKESAEFLVEKYIPDAPPLLRQDMLLSLHAAYTLDEITAQLEEANLAENLTLTKSSPFQFSAYGYLN
ncbi:MAG: class I SAM-dependent methyltransferase [Proteobacteria bacterium]|nr:class I SAM-dependent methyltransferase [Pseudomonadota bacterium]MBU4296428.1 class I SAM-dependent methyltransferase [Pseudomonadota bacterium]MCG2748697.1 class I SAM-dependent methyltransferase [Desulfobulbaceae bacterium]